MNSPCLTLPCPYTTKKTNGPVPGAPRRTPNVSWEQLQPTATLLRLKIKDEWKQRQLFRIWL